MIHNAAMAAFILLCSCIYLYVAMTLANKYINYDSPRRKPYIKNKIKIQQKPPNHAKR